MELEFFGAVGTATDSSNSNTDFCGQGDEP
jgi:hypothetical protein